MRSRIGGLCASPTPRLAMFLKFGESLDGKGKQIHRLNNWANKLINLRWNFPPKNKHHLRGGGAKGRSCFGSDPRRRDWVINREAAKGGVDYWGRTGTIVNWELGSIMLKVENRIRHAENMKVAFPSLMIKMIYLSRNVIQLGCRVAFKARETVSRICLFFGEDMNLPRGKVLNLSKSALRNGIRVIAKIKGSEEETRKCWHNKESSAARKDH